MDRFSWGFGRPPVERRLTTRNHRHGMPSGNKKILAPRAPRTEGPEPRHGPTRAKEWSFEAQKQRNSRCAYFKEAHLRQRNGSLGRRLCGTTS